MSKKACSLISQIRLGILALEIEVGRSSQNMSKLQYGCGRKRGSLYKNGLFSVHNIVTIMLKNKCSDIV